MKKFSACVGLLVAFVISIFLGGCVIDQADFSDSDFGSAERAAVEFIDAGEKEADAEPPRTDTNDSWDGPDGAGDNECKSYIDCPVPTGTCHMAACTNNVCEIVDSPDNSPCFADNQSGHCIKGVCVFEVPVCLDGSQACAIWSDCALPPQMPGVCISPACVEGCCKFSCQ